jgi:hypothetical protein
MFAFTGDLFEGDGEGEKDEAMVVLTESGWVCLSAPLLDVVPVQQRRIVDIELSGFSRSGMKSLYMARNC